MYQGHSVGVVVPAYNEEGFVGDVIREMPSFVDRIYAIDDRSTDGTWDEIRSSARADAETLEYEFERDDSESNPGSDPELTPDHEDDSQILTDGGLTVLTERATVSDSIGRVLPVRHRENRGAGGAIKTGYLVARAEGVDATVTVDADGQMDLSQMSRLLDPLVDGTTDYAKGNRLLSREYRAAMPRFRFIGNATLTFLTKIASGYWKTMDPQNGYTAISHEALEAVRIEELYEYYGYCNDLLVKLNASGMRVADVAMPAVYGDEESSIEYTTYIPKVSLLLLGSFLWRLKTKYLVRDCHPLALFYALGAGTAATGIAGAVWTLYATLSASGSPFLQGSVSLLLFVLGATLLLFAMVFDLRESEHLEMQFQ